MKKYPEKKIYKILEKLKRGVKKELNKGNNEMALELISACANLLYESNIYYRDDFLEEALNKISNSLNFANINFGLLEDKTVIFFDGFGYNDRGLAQIYISALCKYKKVVYVTYEDRKGYIPDIERIIKDNGSQVFYIRRKGELFVNTLRELSGIVEEISPKGIFMYSTPDDVVFTTMMYACNGKCTRYQINVTDHAFWLGAGCLDKCIEFRDYGARVSYEYRGISKNQIEIIPFYPIIDYSRRFQGFPFDLKEGQRIIFSGGFLYKTLGAGNKYYIMVDRILAEHQDTVFWYAGTGDDTEMRKLMSRYPGRVYLTRERKDLFQILEKVDLYLSTYPICGGLLYQYAAMAGKVPVTLKHGELNEGFLLNQENLNIEFYDMEELLKEVDKLLSDKEYLTERSNTIKSSVISATEFEGEVNKVLNGEKTSLESRYKSIDTGEFREEYLYRIRERDINIALARRCTIKASLRYFPIRLLRRIIYYMVGNLESRWKAAFKNNI